MEISENGKKFIKNFEGLRLTAYVCPAGKLTIGYGHTNGVKPNMTITKEQADKFFDVDVRIYVTMVNYLVKVPLTQGQFDALVSFTYNVGIDNFRNSTLLKLLNSGKYNAAAEQFLLWNKIKKNGVFVPCEGLTIRRKAEKEMFFFEQSTLIDVKTAAKILGFGRSTIYQMVQQHKIPHIKYQYPKKYLFELDEIFKFKNSYTVYKK